MHFPFDRGSSRHNAAPHCRPKKGNPTCRNRRESTIPSRFHVYGVYFPFLVQGLLQRRGSYFDARNDLVVLDGAVICAVNMQEI